MNKSTLLTLIFGICLTSSTFSQTADLIVLDARIETMDARYPGGTALALRNGRIWRIGSDREIESLAGPKTKIVRGKGHYLMPGLIDSHAHLMGIGSAQRRVNLVGATSFSDVIDRVKKVAVKRRAGQWTTGRGWDQNLWPDKTFPTHDALSKAIPQAPVALTRVDGHALIANKFAMDLAGITDDTKSPEGGEILRDSKGKATGVFIDAAESLIARFLPADSPATKMADMLAAQDLALSLGITTLHDAGMSRRDVEILDELYGSQKLKLRLYVMLGVSNTQQAQLATSVPPRIADHGGRLTVRALKIYADGALGSRGAALLSDYADRRDHKGLLITRSKALQEISELALNKGYQACVHAIGDRGNRMVLDTWEDLFVKNPQIPGPRFRIEHAQILHQDDIPRFASLGVIASMQTVHCTSDMAWVAARITNGRAEVGAYAWRSLLDAGAVIANGTDSPVESLSPFAGLYAAVTRMSPSGSPPGGWHSHQCMTRKEALHSYTQAGAYSGFQENLLGSLSVGKLADFILVDTNLSDCPVEEILTAKVVATYIGGEEVYRLAQ